MAFLSLRWSYRVRGFHLPLEPRSSPPDHRTWKPSAHQGPSPLSPSTLPESEPAHVGLRSPISRSGGRFGRSGVVDAADLVNAAGVADMFKLGAAVAVKGGPGIWERSRFW